MKVKPMLPIACLPRIIDEYEAAHGSPSLAERARTERILTDALVLNQHPILLRRGKTYTLNLTDGQIVVGNQPIVKAGREGQVIVDCDTPTKGLSGALLVLLGLLYGGIVSFLAFGPTPPHEGDAGVLRVFLGILLLGLTPMLWLMHRQYRACPPDTWEVLR